MHLISFEETEAGMNAAIRFPNGRECEVRVSEKAQQKENQH